MNIGLLTLALTVGEPAALRPGPDGPPLVPAYPFLFVTVNAPKGTKVTWHPTTTEATETSGPVGLRPGYFYRFQLSDIPEQRNVVLFPSIEIRGTLIPRHGLPDVWKHPVPISLTDRDIDRILGGRFVTKVYYLEDPTQAVPLQGTPGEALEGFAESEEDAISDARHRGRPMLILRVGERPFTKAELAFENVPGTILFPGVQIAPIPAAPPIFPFNGIPLYDPIWGPKAAAEECLKDGGDIGPLLGPGPRGTIGGLDPTDTAMMFTTRRGTRVAASNRVCICVPRFGAVRVEAGPAGHQAVRAPLALVQLQPVAVVTGRTPPGVITGFERLGGYIGTQRASMIESRSAPQALVQWSGKPLGLSSIRNVAAVAQVRGVDEITTYHGCVLLLEKSIDPPHPEKIGDVVTITLTFSNPTTEEMTDVIIADDLTPRLEYIEGSAKSDRAATFTISPNGVGSSVLRWAIDGKLMPGERGKIKFQVRIR
jgi:uncharacterized repeat protein (TIGR01451 family)